ncbi:MAG TPA: rhodanese-like domain-containing protein [Methanotrichaceae archaeon]|nr:rhodanese-like domain-containing protein [Methanotrichaceae archaeon]
MALIHSASAGELGCAACADTGWNGSSLLDTIGTGVEDQGPAKTNMAQLSRTVRWNQSLHGFNDTVGQSTGTEGDSPQAARQQTSSSSEASTSASWSGDASPATTKTPATPAIITPERDSSFSDMMAPISSVADFDVILDVSDGAKKYIPGAVHIDYMDFLENSKLKPVPVLAQILGDAGISRSDRLLIYGECQPCGGGPSVSTYVYWMMKYLGHDRVKILDGGIDDWIAAGLPAMNAPVTLAKANYTPELRPELLTNYDYVKNSGAQIVDSRTADEYNAGYIPGAVNIPYDQALDEKHIKDRENLATLFSGLSKDRPVVVYTATGIKASMTWFALGLMGYDARVYSWNDWVDHQPKLQVALTNVSATPNPAMAGDAVKLVAVFGSLNDTSTKKNSAGNMTVLSIKGCATCGFGSPQAFAGVNPDSSAGGIQLGGSGKAQGDGFVCTAAITNSTGGEVKRINLPRVTGDEFAGTWSAEVAPGKYSLNLLASANGVSKVFADVLTIDVKDSGKDFSSIKKLGKY